MTETPIHDRDCAMCGCLTVPRTTWYNMDAQARKRALGEGVNRYQGRGLCVRCYVRASNAGTRADYATEILAGDWMLEDYLHIRADLPDTSGVQRIAVAAPRIGVSPAALERALQRRGVAA